MDHSIGVMLTSFRRPHTLRQQLAAIDSQTVKPSEVVIWHNDGGVQPDVEAMRGRKVVALNYNSGVWPRFSAALWLLPYDFVVVLDDDTIPAPEWLDTCLRCHSAQESLIGVNGVVFPTGERAPREYVRNHRCGKALRVDIVGQGWFASNRLLRFAMSIPRFMRSSTAGEDYHISVAAAGLNLPCLIPPGTVHSWLGSTIPQLGEDSVALYRQSGEEGNKISAHAFYRSYGWKTLYDLEQQCNSPTISART